MILTKQYIHKHSTKSGGFTEPQLMAIGVAWPPKKGWISRSVGKEISDGEQWLFESKMSIKDYRKGEAWK